MPIYEYACRACRHEFETLVRSGETPACRCGSQDLEKKLSAFATQTYGAGEAAANAACGTCGHPAGPGACRFS